MTAFILGASSGVGQALCLELAKKGESLFLVSPDSRDLNAIKNNLELSFNISVDYFAIDVCEPLSSKKIFDAANSFGIIDSLYFPIGFSMINDNGELDQENVERIIDANFKSIIYLCTLFLPVLIDSKNSKIIGFSSIAAIRGRRNNIVYSAAKRGLESYFESIRHLTVGRNCLVQMYRLGYVQTQQNFGKKLLLPQTSPEIVAKYIVTHSTINFGIRCFPRFWGIISIIVSCLPWFIYKKINF